MHGRAGLGGWRWIFIMEGVITVAVAMFAAVFLVKFPDEEMKKPSVKFLKKEDLHFVTERLNADRADVEAEPFSWGKFLEPSIEWFIYGFPLLLMCGLLLVLFPPSYSSSPSPERMIEPNLYT